MAFLNEGDPLYKTRTGVDAFIKSMLQERGEKVKLRNFTEEQKRDIKERVKQIRLEREVFLKENPGHRFAQKRTFLRSRESQISKPV